MACSIWNDEIRAAVERCDAAVLVVTERYVRRGQHYTRDEALLFAQRAAAAVGVLDEPVKSLLERYCPGALPLVVREFYADALARPQLRAVLAQAYGVLDTTLERVATARRFVVLCGEVSHERNLRSHAGRGR